jgi:pilus assembly protein CpaE
MPAKPINTLVALDSGITAESIAPSLPVEEDIRLTGVVEGLEAAARSLEDTPCDVLVVVCSGYSDRVLFLIENAVRQDPQRPVLVVSDGSPNGFVRRVFEVGADDILMLPQTAQQIRFAIQKVIARRHGVVTTDALGRMIVVLGPKGGTGKTLVATNLAVALQEAGERTVIVDLDLQFGDVALCMGLNPDRTIHDLALSEGPMDWEKLESFLATHESGVRALLAPRRPDHASVVTLDLIRDAYAYLRQHFDVIVVDTPPGFTPEVIASIDISNDLVMVGMLDSLSLKNTRLGLETLELMGYRHDDIRVVLNRARTRVGISSTDVSTVLGRPPEVLVPSDREIPRTVNEGVPIIVALPRSEPAEALRSLAAFYHPPIASVPEEETTAATRRRVFGRRG